MLAGARSITAIAEWAADAPQPVRAALGARRHAPGHRGIEALHHIRDVTFAEDASQVRTGNAPAHESGIPAPWRGQPCQPCVGGSAEKVVVEQVGHPGRVAPCRPSALHGEQVVQLGAEQGAVVLGGLLDAQPGSQ